MSVLKVEVAVLGSPSLMPVSEYVKQRLKNLESCDPPPPLRATSGRLSERLLLLAVASVWSDDVNRSPNECLAEQAEQAMKTTVNKHDV